MLSYHATCSKVEVDRLKVTPTGVICRKQQGNTNSYEGWILPQLLVWWTDVSSPPWRQLRSPWALSWASMSSTSTTSLWTTTPWSPPRCGCFWILVLFRSLKLTMRWGTSSTERKTECVCRVTPEWPCPCRFCAAGFSLWGRTTEPWHTTTGGTLSMCHSACLWWSQ